MRQRAMQTTILVLAFALLTATTTIWADDVSGADNLLCSAVQVTQCHADGECLSSPPWELNVPQFIVVDLGNKKLSTTEASGENRTTPIKNLERDGGLIFLQGVENGRAFSFVIAEETGMASIAVARDGMAVTVFGACTPQPASSGKDE